MHSCNCKSSGLCNTLSYSSYPCSCKGNRFGCASIYIISSYCFWCSFKNKVYICRYSCRHIRGRGNHFIYLRGIYRYSYGYSLAFATVIACSIISTCWKSLSFHQRCTSCSYFIPTYTRFFWQQIKHRCPHTMGLSGSRRGCRGHIKA